MRQTWPIDSVVFARGVYALLSTWMLFSVVALGEALLELAAAAAGLGIMIAALGSKLIGLGARAWLLLRFARPRRQSAASLELWQPILLTVAVVLGRLATTIVSNLSNALLHPSADSLARYGQTLAIVYSVELLGDTALLVVALWMTFVHARDLPPPPPEQALTAP